MFEALCSKPTQVLNSRTEALLYSASEVLCCVLQVQGASAPAYVCVLFGGLACKTFKLYSYMWCWIQRRLNVCTLCASRYP